MGTDVQAALEELRQIIAELRARIKVLEDKNAE